MRCDEPVEELAIDHRRPLAIGVQRPPEALNIGQQPGGLQPILREIDDRLEAFQGSTDQHGHLECGELGEDEILVMSEAAGQSRIGGTIPRIGDEAGRRVAPVAEELRQRGMCSVKRREPADRELVQPSSCKHGRMRWQRP